MAFLVLAYPDLQGADYGFIQSLRKDNDELYYSIVDPHFTMVFPVFDQSREAFCQAVIDATAGAEKIAFTIRCATINKDAFKDYYHTFLVPDEGYSKIVKLHDKLYSGQLKDNLRFDIDFIPHIVVGNSKDKLNCKAIADSLNERDLSIAGTIKELAIVEYENNSITRLQDIKLS